MTPEILKRLLIGAAASVVSIGIMVQDFTPKDASELVAYQIRCNQAHAWHDSYVFTSTNGKMAFTDGEAHRPEITAKAYARMGIGIAASLHTQRLARDKMLIIDGKYSPNAKDYEYAGLVWEAGAGAFGVVPAWGGRFNDANHFSCQWKGVK